MAGNVIEYVSPSRAGLFTRRTIYVGSPEMMGIEMLGYGGVSTASVAPGANGVIHLPLILATPFVLSQFFWMNGSVINGNSDIGIYSEDGQVLLASTGATLNAGTMQVVDVADVILPANRRLWLTLGTDSATHQYNRLTLSAPAADYIGIKGNAAGISGSALVVPTSFSAASNSSWRCGITGASVV
jgi:hypothetical protein